MLKKFSLQFINTMVGVVLGLGFAWWTALKEPWSYIAFVFAYIDVIDYWIDYEPSLKKFPAKREMDVMLDLGIIFSLFLYIYATQLSIVYFLAAFMLLKILDFFWLLRAKREYNPTGSDKVFTNTWLKLNIVEVVLSGLLIIAAYLFTIPSLAILITYIIMRVLVRIVSVKNYKRLHLA